MHDRRIRSDIQEFYLKGAKAVRMVLESLISKLKNERIYWFSDNHNVVKIMGIGGKKPKLQDEVFTIFLVLLPRTS